MDVRKPSLPLNLSLMCKLSLPASSLRTLVSLISALKVYKSEYPLPSEEISQSRSSFRRLLDFHPEVTSILRQKKDASDVP